MDAVLNVFKELVIIVSIVIGTLCILALCFWMFWMHPSMTDVKKMNCSLAEFSPDMPLEVKQACREARRKI